jgi:hypothetical protein
VCGHSFCRACIGTWLGRPAAPSCPTCRAAVPRAVPGININLRDMMRELLAIARAPGAGASAGAGGGGSVAHP